MSALNLSARLDRSDPNTPWGFRMAGGKDYGQPLTIQRVTPGSLAAKCGLQVGDAITKIGGMPTDSLKHKDAQSCIIGGGNSVELTLTRGGGLSRPVAAPIEPAYEPSQPTYSAPPSSWNPADYPPNYNTAPKPFTPGGGGGTMPVAVNKQYNTPINMYSVGNVMDSLATQTAGMNVGGQEPIPPWRGSQGPAPGPAPGGRPGMGAPAAPAAPAARPSPAAAPPAARPSPAAAPAARPSPAAPAPAPAAPAAPAGTWQPKIPTGPRKMKVGRPGEVKTFSTPQAGKIPICDKCGVTIRGPFILALDRTWCAGDKCFTCSNPMCSCPLVDKGFVEEEGQLFCEADYRQYFAPRCAKCGEPIIGEVVNALNATYHMDCFLCDQCGKPIGTGSFHTEEGKIYCTKDWQAMFQTKCCACDFPIEPGDRWVEALNQNWHSECFNCSSCQINLEGQSFVAKGGKPYCKKQSCGKGGRRF